MGLARREAIKGLALGCRVGLIKNSVLWKSLELNEKVTDLSGNLNVFERSYRHRQIPVGLVEEKGVVANIQKTTARGNQNI